MALRLYLLILKVNSTLYMRKRLVRIFRDQLSPVDKVEIPKDYPISVVLKTGDTLYGKLEDRNENQLQLQDGRFHRHIIPVPDIDLIIYDFRDRKI